MRSPAKTCYVSMPFGQKIDPGTGRTIDFDAIYRELLKPASEAAGLATSRADELEPSPVLLRPIMTAM